MSELGTVRLLTSSQGAIASIALVVVAFSAMVAGVLLVGRDVRKRQRRSLATSPYSDEQTWFGPERTGLTRDLPHPFDAYQDEWVHPAGSGELSAARWSLWVGILSLVFGLYVPVKDAAVDVLREPERLGLESGFVAERSAPGGPDSEHCFRSGGPRTSLYLPDDMTFAAASDFIQCQHLIEGSPLTMELQVPRVISSGSARIVGFEGSFGFDHGRSSFHPNARIVWTVSYGGQPICEVSATWDGSGKCVLEEPIPLVNGTPVVVSQVFNRRDRSSSLPTVDNRLYGGVWSPAIMVR